MIAVSTGELIEQIISPTDADKVVLLYNMKIAVAAPSVSFAIGAFEISKMNGWDAVGSKYQSDYNATADTENAQAIEDLEGSGGGLVFYESHHLDQIHSTTLFLHQVQLLFFIFIFIF